MKNALINLTIHGTLLSIICAMTLTDVTRLRFGFGLVLVWEYLSANIEVKATPENYWRLWVVRPLYYLFFLAVSLLIDAVYTYLRRVLN